MQLLFSAGMIFKISRTFHFLKEKLKIIHVHLSVDVRVIVRILKRCMTLQFPERTCWGIDTIFSSKKKMQFYMHTFDCSKTDYSTKKSSLLCDFSFKANKFHIMWPWISVILGKKTQEKYWQSIFRFIHTRFGSNCMQSLVI